MTFFSLVSKDPLIGAVVSKNGLSIRPATKMDRNHV